MLTLKLDSSYRPVGIIDARKALVMCFVDRAKVVEFYKEHSIKTVTSEFRLPSVIVIDKFVKYRPTSLVCSKKNVMWRDQYICQYCNKQFLEKDLSVDHMLPKSRGGERTWTNLVTACKKCNQKKANRTPEEAKMMPVNKPRKPVVTLLKTLHKTKIKQEWIPYLWNYNK